jgi:ABC-type uncharacterized transport system permease subunit
MNQFSKFFALNGRDLVKGVIVAVLASVVTALAAIIESGNLPTSEQWRSIAMMAIAAGLSYFLKNFLTNSEDKFLLTEPKSEEPQA